MFVFYVIYVVFFGYTICALSVDKYNGFEWKCKGKRGICISILKYSKNYLCLMFCNTLCQLIDTRSQSLWPAGTFVFIQSIRTTYCFCNM